MLRTLLTLCCSLFALFLTGQGHHEITIKIDGYNGEVLTLANNIMDKQYVVDTARVNPQGEFVFASDTAALPPGIYLIVLSPENNYFQILVDDANQVFSIDTSVDKLSQGTVSGSPANQLLKDYLLFLEQQQVKAEPFRALLADTTLTDISRETIVADLDKIDEVVTAYQKQLISDHPESFTAAIIRTNRPPTPPDFSEIADQEQRNEAQFRWLQKHYLDDINLRDERLLRTPFLLKRIETFTDRLHIQHPDSINAAIDQVLERMDPAGELFKFYVVHFTNKAASSDIVGHDGIYVHMVDNYYSPEIAYWAEAEQVAKMQEQAAKLRPVLIGKTAPDISMRRRDGTPVTLHEVDARYTILYFWAFDCSHCKKSTPHMKDFYQKWHDKGVEIFSVCTKQSEIGKCWEYVEEYGIGDWLHATDKYLRFYRAYDIHSTPMIFVLDEDKTIISKRIGAEQLDELLTELERVRLTLEENKG